ncbi:MAG: TIR domain-containing protein [Pseudomonadota bacterium]
MGGSDQPPAADGAPRAQPGEQGPDVFLSYSRVDQPRARLVFDAMEAAGISVWWDDMLEGGTRFHQVTEFNLENAAAVVVLWTKTSVASHWVHDEATRGRDRGVLIPVSIDGSLPPLGFRQFQWIDMSNSDVSPNDPQTIKLIEAIKAKRDGTNVDLPRVAPASIDTSVPPSVPSPSGSGFRLDRRAAIIGGGVATIGAIGLATWGSGILSGSGGTKRVAVMPFDVLGNPGEQSTILSGISQQIRTQLSRNPLLHVAAQTSSQALKESGKTASAICEELQVDYLLTGSVTLEGERLDVGGELIEGRADRTLLPIKEVVPVGSILTLQGQIASDVIRELTASEQDGEGTELGGTENVAAYDAYLRGRELYDAGIDETSDRAALAKFDEAIAIDPAYAAAHTMRGRTIALIGTLYGDRSERDKAAEDGLKSAREAIRLAPDFADGHSVLGYIFSNELLAMKKAREPYAKSVQLGQGDAEILSRYAVYRSRMGDFVAAREAIGRALALDPLNARVFRFAGNIEYDSKQYGAAIQRFRDALTIQANASMSNYLVGITQLALGETQAAKDSFDKESRFVWQKTGLAIAEHMLGNSAAAQQHFGELQDRQGDKSNYQYMQVQAQWGDEAEALSALDAAWAARDGGLIQLKNDPLLDPIRQHPRFQEILVELGFD